ncbi:MAG TPA: hypothetical protein VEZ14_03290 [Dehalococcoidia bacterium]|nr:hypothetical protein [Dehalococcoidia bacterium]
MRWVLAAVIVLATAGCVGREFQAPTPWPTPVVAPQPTHLSAAPEGYYVRVDCLDRNRDGTVTVADLDPSRVPDLNLDGRVDLYDVAMLWSIQIPLKSHPCLGQDVQFLIAPPHPATPVCGGTPFAVIVAITGATNGQGLELASTGAGVRSIVNRILTALNARGWQTEAILATPDISGAKNPNSAAESWLDAVLAGIIHDYPCARLALIGHSFGGVTATAVSAALERQGHAANVRFLGLIDRVTLEYLGDGRSLPAHPVILNVFQQNEQPHSGAPNGAPLAPLAANATDWDVSHLKQPPLLHVTIENDPDVDACIASSALLTLEGSGLPSCAK